jgi:hypothetical protein
MRALAVFFSLLLSLLCDRSGERAAEIAAPGALALSQHLRYPGWRRTLHVVPLPRPFGRESCKLLHEPNKLIFDYTQMMLAGLYLNPNPKRILITAKAAARSYRASGNVSRCADRSRRDRPSGRFALRRGYFDFKPGPKTKVTISDGRVFVKRVMAQKPNYDLVLLDAFDADYIPEHMLTREFLQK